jgi:hypothetical protein
LLLVLAPGLLRHHRPNWHWPLKQQLCSSCVVPLRQLLQAVFVTGFPLLLLLLLDLIICMLLLGKAAAATLGLQVVTNRARHRLELF